MKILHVITSLAMGGAESLVVQLSPMLRDKGNEVEVVCFSGSDTPLMRELKDSGIRVHVYGENCSVYDPRIIPWLRGKMAGFDVVHTHNTSPQFFAAIAAYGLKCRLVTTEHNTSNRRRKWWLGKMLDCWLYARYAATICISHKAEENLREFIGTGFSGIVTIENGIKISRFTLARPLENAKVAGERVIAMVAGFRSQKDQDTLIRAMKLLPEHFTLWLVGDGVRRLECESLAASEGVGGRVRFMGVRTDVPALLRAADYVVMSSHFEGLSLSSVEGMSVGKPFLASDVDGLREVVNGAGVLFPHADSEAFAREILRLEGDVREREAVAERCRERAARFDIDTMVERYMEVYRELAGK